MREAVVRIFQCAAFAGIIILAATAESWATWLTTVLQSMPL